MAETLGIKHDFSSVAQDIILVWYEHSNPTAEVDRILIPAPHAAGDVTIVPNLNTTVYDFKFYETADGVTFGTLLSSWALPIKSTKQTVEPYHYVVGGVDGETGVWADPVDGGTQINDNRLAGADSLMVFSSVGFRQPWEYTVLPSGGIQLAIEGDVFADKEKWTIVAIRKADSTGSMPSGSGGAISGINKVSADGAFDSTYYSKKNIADFATVIGSTSFPAFATIPNGTRARFSTFTGFQRYWKLAFSSGDVIRVNGKDYNMFPLAKDEMIELEWLDGECFVEYKGRIHLTGSYILANNKDMVGTALCDGDGIEHDISDWQRLIDELPAELKVSYSDWNLTTNVTVGDITKTYYKNRGKFAVDSGGGKFKFPDLRGQAFIALLKTDGTIDSTRLSQGAAGMQAQELISHKHDQDLAPNANSGGTLIYGRGGAPLSTKGQTASKGGSAQRIDNIGMYGLVYL